MRSKSSIECPGLGVRKERRALQQQRLKQQTERYPTDRVAETDPPDRRPGQKCGLQVDLE